MSEHDHDHEEHEHDDEPLTDAEARAELEGRPVTVWRARVGADGSFEPLEVQPEGGRRMTSDAWRRGLR